MQWVNEQHLIRAFLKYIFIKNQACRESSVDLIFFFLMGYKCLKVNSKQEELFSNHVANSLATNKIPFHQSHFLPLYNTNIYGWQFNSKCIQTTSAVAGAGVAVTTTATTSTTTTTKTTTVAAAAAAAAALTREQVQLFQIDTNEIRISSHDDDSGFQLPGYFFDPSLCK